MMRKGLGGIRQQQKLREEMRQTGKKMEEQKLQDMQKKLEDFRDNLEKFAVDHKKEINDNPVFRNDFLKLCREIGVDPLSSNSKGSFLNKLQNEKPNDFYYELAIQITNICIALRPKNGGYLEESECLRLLNKLRGAKASSVELEDIGRALESLEKLSSDFKIVRTGNKKMIISNSVSFDSDQMTIL
mmetsp:Transcript_6086/g.9792  ORF Transcript_6086/g.9792 Transcript_6086/m.9792 type:complete len:187 (+) Transcript_6086:10-570(+)